MNIVSVRPDDLDLRTLSPRSGKPAARLIPLDARTALLQAALQPARIQRDAAHALAQLAVEHALPPGCPVFGRGDAAHGLWLVASGQVALGTLSQGRFTQQTRRVEPGQWLDAASAWLQGRYFEDAWTQSEVLLWSFRLDAVHACCIEHPSLAEGLLTVLAARVRDLTEGTLGLMQKDAEARCATWLLQHAELRPGRDGGSAVVTLRERKRAIASQLAVTPETFSRVLRQLRDKQVIEVSGYTVRVLELEALRRIAGA